MDQALHQIIKEAKAGDKQAFSSLMTRYKGQVFRQAYAVMGDWMEAEDIVQETFIKVYSSLSKLESEFAFSSWLSRIVSRLCYDHLNKKKNIIAVDNLDDRIIDDAMERKHHQINVHEAMKKLTYDHREAIVLRDLQGFSYIEIAAMLSIPVGTVKSRINTARNLLKNELIK